MIDFLNKLPTLFHPFKEWFPELKLFYVLFRDSNYPASAAETFEREITYLATGTAERTGGDFMSVKVWHCLPLHPEREVLLMIFFPASPNKKVSFFSSSIAYNIFFYKVNFSIMQLSYLSKSVSRRLWALFIISYGFRCGHRRPI